MPEKIYTECPNCDTEWDETELHFQVCDNCGYPLHEEQAPIELDFTKEDPAEEKTFPCKQCGELPYMVKHTFEDCNEVHWSIKCSCKQTQVYHSFVSAESEWEGGLYKKTKEEHSVNIH